MLANEVKSMEKENEALRYENALLKRDWKAIRNGDQCCAKIVNSSCNIT